MSNKWLLLVAVSSIVMNIVVTVARCDELEIDGDGKFNMELTEFKRIREMWQKLTDDADDVETPRPISGDNSSRVNVNMYEKIINEQERVKRGDPEKNQAKADNDKLLQIVSKVDSTRRISQELYQWIQRRAESIGHKYELYADDLNDPNSKMSIGRAMVTHILLLNTFVDLDNLVKEKFDSSFKSAKWIQKKLNALRERYDLSLAFVKAWLDERIRQVVAIEQKLTETNYEWLANMRDIRRFMHEQRFSDELAQKCADFLKGEWQGYDRATRLDLFKDDVSVSLNARGMLYKAFNGELSFSLPFAVQDSILRGY